ncbi:bifunctional nicotinamidase/pyrazinamidase [Roseibacillus ishigakijimensis]|uniref:Nicotinamidase n=1 Tax=Roseibacillus ishigakijimensis TaxID=454146 RepID=A0A934RS03_9BACT|nr:bifunctional nicotinamidase/pyrazinamidase [Roseibacillus ishigakijimensis]MBK1834581.1 bifunctional nicotinamidase/pyrazinamidase [Roseibacillus ishigakijimensis]
MKTLLLIDLQNDFLPGGALAVRGGDELIPLINNLMPGYDHILASQDWHPANHGSFAASHPGQQEGEVISLHGLPQVLWPVHCVQNTPGADFAPGLHTQDIAEVILKGTDPAIDSYSAFYDNGRRQSTGLAETLRTRGTSELHVCGLATDYCVKFTVLDALAEGFATTLIANACRAVELTPGDGEKALAEMAAAGARIITTNER